jgi:hypothetical protein
MNGLKKVADGRLKHPRSQWIDVILDDMEKTEGKGTPDLQER